MASHNPMKPPKSGVKIRMYRQGHGDCFLLAFPKEGAPGEAVYVLIDCGRLNGSELRDADDIKTFRDEMDKYYNRHLYTREQKTEKQRWSKRFTAVSKQFGIDEVHQDIHDATGGHLDLVVITHEHTDHVNGFIDRFLDTMKIDHVWMGWTDSEKDEVAIDIRKKWKDEWMMLTSVTQRLAASGEPAQQAAAERIEELLEFDSEDTVFGAKGVGGKTLKAAIKRVKERAAACVRETDNDQTVNRDDPRVTSYLMPGKAVPVPATDGARAYVLGPPRNRFLLQKMDPQGDEGFDEHAMSMHSAFADAAMAFGGDGADSRADLSQPFAERHRLPVDGAGIPAEDKAFFERRYGRNSKESDVTWRHIEGDWLMSGEMFALYHSSYTNNTSLVLAFELPASKRVLLFVGDAQRGNWWSWGKKIDSKWSTRTIKSKDKKGEIETQTWKVSDDDGTREVSIQDLLARTVFYKVGHHGSHNATLKPQLEAMGEEFEEFAAMIPCHEEWARNWKPQRPWDHPLKSIKDALAAKAGGHLFQIDDHRVPKPDDVSRAAWNDRFVENKFFFEYTVFDE